MNQDQLKEFIQAITGTVITPKDPGYDKVQNTISAKGAPALVVQVADEKDISLAVDFATNNKLTLSVRSGGHNVAGFSTNDGGLVIDLSRLNKITVTDKDKGLVSVGPGALWIDVATTLHDYGLSLSSGDTKSVGVGGLTVGGGIGWMARKYGLAIDSLIGTTVVLADGKVVLASQSEHPDLFWALRGGGGNFGIVTQFEFAAHQVNRAFIGHIIYKLDDVGKLLKGWRDYMRNADENLTTVINILPSFMGNPPMFMLTCCYAGSDQPAAEAALDPLKKLGEIVSEDIQEKNYSDILEDAHPPEGVKILVDNAFFKDFSDEVIDAIVAARQAKEDIIIQVRGFGGAFARVPADETAFAYRDAEVMLLSPTFVPPNATPAQEKEALTAWESVKKFGVGAYSGFISDPTDANIHRIFPKPTYDRLAKVKQQYDPQNVFNQNYNIRP